MQAALMSLPATRGTENQAASHSHLLCPLAIPLNLLSGNVAHQHNTAQLSQATTNPGKANEAEKFERKQEEW